MGLEHGDDPSPIAFAGGTQRCPEFRGMVRIVVDHCDPQAFTLPLKTTHRPSERPQGPGDRLGRHAQLGEGREAGERVQDVVPSGHFQCDCASCLPPFQTSKLLPGCPMTTSRAW